MSTLLEVKDITKIYPNQPKPGLDHVSFEVMQGEFLGIMGASGSGKTTLLNVLSTIDIPTSGSIRMGGKKIQELSQTQAADFRKNNLGFIFQEYFLLDSLTVQEIAGIVTLLGISVDQSAIPLIYPAAVKAILSFVIVVLITLTLSNASLLRKSTLLDLVRLEKKTENPIHPHAITAILGVGFLSAGYGLALDIMRGKQSLWNIIGFSPIAMLTLLCVVAGTILFMYSFLPYVCQKIRQKKP